jgi:vacuolar-type H+-ATPase subunit D/Vma8
VTAAETIRRLVEEHMTEAAPIAQALKVIADDVELKERRLATLEHNLLPREPDEL